MQIQNYYYYYYYYYYYTKTQTLSPLVFLCTYPFHTLSSLSLHPHSINLFYFSYSFLLEDNWWLSCCYGYSLKMLESKIFLSLIGNAAFLWRVENRGVRCPVQNFWDIQETRISAGKSGRMGSLRIWRREKKNWKPLTQISYPRPAMLFHAPAFVNKYTT